MQDSTAEVGTDGVGARVAERRKLKGLTQAQLAQRSHVSLSLIRKVEQGSMPASPAFVSATARALNVGVPELLGQPAPMDTPTEYRVQAVVPPLRRELAAFRLPPEDISVRPLAELSATVERASRLRHAVDLTTLGTELPALLAELRAAAQSYEGAERERVYGLLAETYAAAGQVAYKLGYIDLASLTTERVEWAAAQSGDELAVAAADFYRAGELIGAADWTGAQRFLESSRQDIKHRVRGDDEPGLSMWGQLHLKSGLAAARAGDRATADAHLTEARGVAQHVAADRDDYRLAFNVGSVNIWSVGLAVEASDGTEAVKRAQEFVLPPTAPRERVGHHFIDLARGYLLHGDRDGTLGSLMQARRTAPQQTRYHPMVAETVRALARAERRRSDTVGGFARWLGISA